MPIYNAPILAVDPVETRRYAGLQKAEDFKQELIDNACQEAQLLIQPRASGRFTITMQKARRSIIKTIHWR